MTTNYPATIVHLTTSDHCSVYLHSERRREGNQNIKIMAGLVRWLRTAELALLEQNENVLKNNCQAGGTDNEPAYRGE